MNFTKPLRKKEVRDVVAKDVKIKIDDEFAALIPPLSADELSGLEASIVSDGCRDALVVWSEKSILLDGHNRYRICKALKLPFETVELTLPDRAAAKVWLIKNQVGRRNLSETQRAMCAARLANLERGDNQHAPIGGTSQEEAAELFNVGERSLQRAKHVLDHGTPELIAACDSDRISVSVAAEIADLEPAEQVKLATAEGAPAAGRVAKEQKKAKKKKRVADRAKKKAAAVKALSDLDIPGFLHGDFREVLTDIPDASVSLFFTDPPYDRKTLPLYGDLAQIASNKLVHGGSLICYLGQFQIHEVLNLVTPHLRFWWTLAVIHEGKGPFARMTEYGVVVKWKPLLWFVKGTRGDKETFVDDAVKSVREKDAHPWQQSAIEAAYYIGKLTSKGELVVDPFCGGGTTAIACAALGRKFVTCDVDADALKIAKNRMNV